jgi:hypothetical protein
MQELILSMEYYSHTTLEQSRSNAPNLKVKFADLRLESTHLDKVKN